MIGAAFLLFPDSPLFLLRRGNDRMAAGIDAGADESQRQARNLGNDRRSRTGRAGRRRR